MKVQFLLCVATALSMSAFAYADDSASVSSTTAIEPAALMPASTANTLNASRSNVTGGILKYIFADDFSTYHGPTLNHMDSEYSTNNSGTLNPNAVNGIDNEVRVAYLYDQETVSGIGPDFNVNFSSQPEKGATIGDTGLEWFRLKTIDSNGFRLATNMLLQAPTSLYSQFRHETLALKTTPYFWYNIPNSRLRLGAWTEAKWYDGVTMSNDIKLYAAPYISYVLNSKLSLVAEYEFYQYHMVGDASWHTITYQRDLDLGFNYMITKDILINPYVQLFPSNEMATNYTAVGAIFYARVL